ncbi:hypothetical protein VSU01S_40450 [Vibrio superstes NBRC 103154]|uniref:Uncharacterized protein n=1 Tax=Vibrio superstes NBRC 103154 TaxID=1219062 RepID=A0A511QWP5_9VIBR|nr:hypothetical protein [Vibrio superstes]GEM81800.1 hypothetical protein VSU01S_40450 [Vibrio superstes NBRC 103154]
MTGPEAIGYDSGKKTEDSVIRGEASTCIQGSDYQLSTIHQQISNPSLPRSFIGNLFVVKIPDKSTRG